MKVVVLGGYGVFGRRLAELLVRDGHEVWIAGRDRAQAAACARQLEARALEADREGDLSPIFEPAPDVVVDAAGPFQHYDADPYRVPRMCIEAGADYLDLSDDAGFTAGIADLDTTARAAGRRILSGVSSVPGLSSTVVQHLRAGLDEIDVIDTAILPGNRAPRGRSLIQSIVGQVGSRVPVWRGGGWQQVPYWSDRRRYQLRPGLSRAAWLVSVPDLQLFPAHFGARSVMFRAGMELAVLNRAMSVLSFLRRRLRLPGARWQSGIAHGFSKRLERFGSDVGGMVVAVTGAGSAGPVNRRWRLVVENGDGPFIPGIVARALLRDLDGIEPGARPCLAEVPLAQVDAAIADLAATTGVSETPSPPLFMRLLGDRWSDLPLTLRQAHRVQDVARLAGEARVDRGRSLAARLAAFVFRFPKAAESVPVTVTMTRTKNGETWERNFGGRRFRSRISGRDGAQRCRERFGPFRFELDLPVEDGSLAMPVRRGWLLGVPLPRFLLPRSDTREAEQDGRFHFDVALRAPLGGGLIVRYRGWLRPVAAVPATGPVPQNCNISVT